MAKKSKPVEAEAIVAASISAEKIAERQASAAEADKRIADLEAKMGFAGEYEKKVADEAGR